MSALDVISVDTAVAHVAGASGRQCLLLVPDFGTDWRWMRNRDDSPTIYRSAAEGDWSEVTDRLAAEAWRLHDARG
jgi:ADP-heptose:LPS heptosyltransferase